MAIDVWAALSGEDIFSSIALVLFIIYFLWLYNWGKNKWGKIRTCISRNCFLFNIFPLPRSCLGATSIVFVSDFW